MDDHDGDQISAPREQCREADADQEVGGGQEDAAVRTGEVLGPPASLGVASYNVRVEGSDIEIPRRPVLDQPIARSPESGTYRGEPRW